MAPRYEIIRRIAVGGMGEIFLARQPIAGVSRLVVVKRLLPQMVEDPRLLGMFIDEARIAANLTAPGIVQIYEFGEDADGHYIVMEYVPGHSVARMLARARRDGVRIATPIGAYLVHELARALDHAHHARDSDGKPLQIVHRDVSPSNLLVSYDGDVKLMDFGVARAANRANVTSDGTVRGKLAYMAPEQMQGRDLDARADLFAAGVLLWELTVGQRLFDAPNEVDVVRAVLEGPIRRPSAVVAGYPEALETVVMSALEREPDRRVASARELAAGLKRYLRAEPADRDEVAALMKRLFPEDLAAAQELAEVRATTGASPAPPIEQPPTVRLAHAEPPPKPSTHDGPAGAPAATGVPSRRRRGLALGVLGVGLGLGAAAIAWRVTGAGTASSEGADASRGVPVVAVATEAGPGRIDAAVAPDGPPADAAVRALADAAVTHRGARGPVRPPPARVDAALGSSGPPPIDAAAPAAVAVVPTAWVRIDRAATEIGAIYIDPDVPGACSVHAVPMRCKLPVGPHTLQVRVPGGPSWTTAIDVPASGTTCRVSIARQQVSCPA